MPYPKLTSEEEATGRDAFMRLGAPAPDDDGTLNYDRMREWRLMWIQKARQPGMGAGMGQQPLTESKGVSNLEDYDPQA